VDARRSGFDLLNLCGGMCCKTPVCAVSVTAEAVRPSIQYTGCSNTKITEGIKVSLPGRDCMTEDRMTTDGWRACTSVEGTRASSMGDAIEQTIDSTRLSQEKSSLGQNRVTIYYPSRLLQSSQAA
jgi:hypothetical protein